MEGMRYTYSVDARMASEAERSASSVITETEAWKVTLCFDALMEVWIAVFTQTEYLTQDTIHDKQMPN